MLVHVLVAVAHVRLQTESYSTNFSSIDDNWVLDQSCFDCSASNPDECTKNFASAVVPASISDNMGVTITTTRRTNFSWCDPTAGGSSGKLTFNRYLNFGTIRVRSRYFPGSASAVSTAKGFIGLEDSSSGAITITIHGKGASPSGAPSGADWTKYMQSSIYQHGDDHNKEFTSLGSSTDLANELNWWEIAWSSTSITISLNGNVVRTMTDSSKIPQSPLKVQLHSRSIGYSELSNYDTFASYISEFQFEPAPTAAKKR